MLTLPWALAMGVFAIVLCPRHCAADQGKETAPKIDKFVSVFGAKIHYVEAGSGAPVILIHGLADDATTNASIKMWILPLNSA
jgi:hypothetical protein